MANHYYIISEVQFFHDKEDKKTWDFISDTGIDLNQICSSKMPTLIEIKKSVLDFGLDTNELFNEPDKTELFAKKNEHEILWFIFTDIKNDTTPISMFEIGRGSSPSLTIDFIKYLGMTHGNFLFYCDAGIMSLITIQKDRKTILQEMGFE